VLTDQAMEAIFTCWAAKRIGKVYAPAVDWLPACEEAREKGWLDRETHDGSVAYVMTDRGETALALNNLTSDPCPN
jgi:hypothetical protein